MEQLISIDDLQRPPEIGEWYLVPCVIHPKGYWELPDFYAGACSPVHNLPHNDIENGQNYIHYHADFRFINEFAAGGDSAIDPYNGDKYEKVRLIRFTVDEKLVIKYLKAQCFDLIGRHGTERKFIDKSTFKHHCIHKNKCPHRGYDLTNTRPVNGIITCPLHKLEFSAETKLLIN